MKVFVTGATGAIGKEIVLALVNKNHDLIIGCRSLQKGQQLADEIYFIYGRRPEIVLIDLADSASVSRAANMLRDRGIDLLINNAGVMNGKYILDPDGHENTLNVNYHNTRLLTDMMLPFISDNGAVVFTTSATRRWFPFQKIREDIPESGFGRLRTYALSKKLITRYAATLASSPEFSKRGIRFNCADPGVVDTPMLTMGKWFDSLTDVFFRPFCLKPEIAAKAAIKAAEAKDGGHIFRPHLWKSRNRKKL